MAISPKTSIWINVFVALLAAIVSGTVSFAGLIPDPVSHAIITWAAFGLSVYGVVNAALHSVSSEKEGPMANVQIRFEKIPPKGGTAIAVLLGVLISFGFITVGNSVVLASARVVHTPVSTHVKKKPVHGIVRKPVVKPIDVILDNPAPIGLAGPKQIVSMAENFLVYPHYGEIGAGEALQGLAWDKNSITPDTKPQMTTVEIVPTVAPLTVQLSTPPKMNGIIADIWKKLQSVTLSDLQYANNLALANQDTVASSCYSALIALIQKSQAANIDPTTGQPLALPTVHLVTDLENVIILYRELQPTSATSVACAPFMNAVKVGSISALLSGLGTGALAGGLLIP